MSTRRDFVAQVAASLTATTPAVADNAVDDPSSNRAQRRAASSPIDIKSVVRRDDTILRLGGSGDNYPITWIADDRQLVSVTDGFGWLQDPKGRYAARLWGLSGDPYHSKFEDLGGYPDLVQGIGENYCRYLGYGTLAVDGRIYQSLNTPNYPPNIWLDSKMIGAKLIYSPDGGRTWHNQDGTTPVVWEDWYDRSAKNLLFFREPNDAFSFLSFLQMGRDYALNRDGYVYVYSPNGNYEGRMNELVMARVPKQRVANRSAYEFFAGLSDRDAVWSKDIAARSIVHTFPTGYVNRARHTGDDHPFAWCPSIAYNAALDLYLMANWGMSCSSDGIYFAGPSYLGFWAAAHPWGPWIQIYEEKEWMPANERESRCYSPQIAPKWIAQDGKSFWLVWTDCRGVLDPRAKDVFRRELPTDPRKKMELIKLRQQITPYYMFNTQRFDLHIL